MGTIRSNALRNSAQGEACTLQIAGICCGDWSTTVLAHLPSETKGMGTKADDLSACYACGACHDLIDRHVWKLPDADWYMRRAMERTWRRLLEKGILTLKGQKS